MVVTVVMMVVMVVVMVVMVVMIVTVMIMAVVMPAPIMVVGAAVQGCVHGLVSVLRSSGVHVIAGHLELPADFRLQGNGTSLIEEEEGHAQDEGAGPSSPCRQRPVAQGKVSGRSSGSLGIGLAFPSAKDSGVNEASCFPACAGPRLQRRVRSGFTPDSLLCPCSEHQILIRYLTVIRGVKPSVATDVESVGAKPASGKCFPLAGRAAYVCRQSSAEWSIRPVRRALSEPPPPCCGGTPKFPANPGS